MIVPYLGEGNNKTYSAEQSALITFYGEKSKGLKSGITDDEIVETRKKETKKASRIIGVKNEH